MTGFFVAGFVVAGLVPAILVLSVRGKTRMPGTGPSMTDTEVLRPLC